MAGGAAPAQLLMDFENAGSLLQLSQGAERDVITLGLRAWSQEGRTSRVRTKSLGQDRVPTGGWYRCFPLTTRSPINLWQIGALGLLRDQLYWKARACRPSGVKHSARYTAFALHG